MALYPKMVLTNAGLDAIAESASTDKDLIFTGVAFGAGSFDGDIASLTALVDQRAQMSVNTATNNGNGQFSLSTTLVNTDVTTGFFAKEVGVKAQVGSDGDEVLFAYTNGGNYVDYVPDNTQVFDPHPFIIAVITGSAANVTVKVNAQSLVNVEELNAHNAATDAHTNLIQVTTTADKPASMADRGLWVEIVG